MWIFITFELPKKSKIKKNHSIAKNKPTLKINQNWNESHEFNVEKNKLLTLKHIFN